jgi:hypothetical protein
MPNVSILSPITVFRDEPGTRDFRCAEMTSDYLRRREQAERAAAKASDSLAARRAHQELAQLIFEKRRVAEAGGDV